MAKVIKFHQGDKQIWHVLALSELPQDMKRMLIVQVRELIHEIEDCDSSNIHLRLVELLERCFKSA